MILRPEVIRERLRHLRQVVRNLEPLREIPPAEFVASYRHYWLAERGLQLAAEAVFDVGAHILTGHFNVSPADYEDVLRGLARQRVIPEALHDRLRGLGGFRNILVHAYLEIDEERVYAFLREKLGVFLDFADQVETFLDRE